MAKPKNVDEYLHKLGDHFARPILEQVREIIHDTAPQIQEAIKWGAPSFEHKGLMMSMVAFKESAAVWFHKGALFNDSKNLLEASTENTKAMRKYVLRSMDELDVEGFKGLIHEAIAKNESGAQVDGFNQRDQKYDHSQRLEDALKNNPKAQETFKALSDYKKREFVEHIESAKQDATKERRLQKSLGMLEKGLGLNDKYR